MSKQRKKLKLIRKKHKKNTYMVFFFIQKRRPIEKHTFIDEHFEYFKTNILELSIYKTTTDMKFGDQFLTLSTCEYSQDNGRFVVVAKKIDNN